MNELKQRVSPLLRTVLMTCSEAAAGLRCCSLFFKTQREIPETLD